MATRKPPGALSLSDLVGEALFVAVSGLIVYSVWKKKLPDRGGEQADGRTDAQTRGTYR